MAEPRVVAKYDLYFSPEAISNQEDCPFYLMRFLAMKSQLDNETNDINIKFKPKSKRCRIEVDVSPHSSNFSMDTARTLATKSAPFTFDVDHVNKYFYSSTTIKVDDKQLMIGKLTLDGTTIVLSPVNCIFNMRPDFSHFDRKDEVDIKEELKAVTVKFAAPDKVGYSSRPANVDESLNEEFRNFKYYACDSREAGTTRRDFLKYTKQLVKEEPNRDSGSVQPETISDVKPKIESSLLNKPSSSLKQNELKQINVAIKECLLRAKVMSFDEIGVYVKKTTGVQFSSEQIIPTIESFAILVQGNWVVKSDLLYVDTNDPKNPSITEITGIPVGNLVLARDYLLWAFCQERKISRIALRDKVKVPDHDVLDLLKQLAALDQTDKMWEFKLPTDDDFIENYPDIITRQKSLWKVRKSNKLGHFF